MLRTEQNFLWINRTSPFLRLIRTKSVFHFGINRINLGRKCLVYPINYEINLISRLFSFLDTDLHAVIKKGNILKDIHKRYIMYQLLKSTMYMHSGNVIHRDHKASDSFSIFKLKID